MSTRHSQGRNADRAFTAIVTLAGLTVVSAILALAVFLTRESRYALDQKFTYGYRFSVQDAKTVVEDVSMDPYSSVLTAHTEGASGVDEKEEGITMPTLEELLGSAQFGSGSPITDPELGAVDYFRDNWDGPLASTQERIQRLVAFATPEFKGDRMALHWAPDQGFDPAGSPFRLMLRLVSAPAGSDVKIPDVDLVDKPKGTVELPAFIARTDADRASGYVFEVSAQPRSGPLQAVLGSFFAPEWGPTLAHPKFGVWPLLLSTLIITGLAVLIATPLAFLTATYLSEFAPIRLREWLKPVIELLASVPTVVLGYFGLILIAPSVQKVLSQAVHMDSGRSMLTTALVMAFLILPTITTFAEDALRTVHDSNREGGTALGLTVAESTRQVVLPAARTGLVAATLLGTARAVGETMIVWMLSGGTPVMPDFSSGTAIAKTFGGSTRGMPDTVAIEMGNVVFEGVHYGYLFLIGLMLFLITLGINLVGYRMSRRAA